MNDESIILSMLERRLLKKIEKKGYPYNETTRMLKQIQALYAYGLIELCVDDRFPSNGESWDGNSVENAYKVSQIKSSRYWLKWRRHLGSEVRSWLAIGISCVSLAISAVALIIGIL